MPAPRTASDIVDFVAFEQGLITRQNSVEWHDLHQSGSTNAPIIRPRRHSSLQGSSTNHTRYHGRNNYFRNSTSTASSEYRITRMLGGNNDGPQHTPRTIADPPRPPKPGMEWVWFPAGYWAERPIVVDAVASQGTIRRGSSRRWFMRTNDRRSSSRSQIDFDMSTKLRQDVVRKSSAQSQKPRRSEAESVLEKFRASLSFIDPTHFHFTSPEGVPEGLYCKTRRNFGQHRGKKHKKVSTPNLYL